MGSSPLNILLGIAAAAAGFSGDKVAKNGSIPGLDLAAILPAMLGKTGGGSGIAGVLASVATKSGLLNSSTLGNLTGLAGSLLSAGKTGAKEKSTGGGIAGLAAAVVGTSGSGADLSSIATLASTLAKSVKGEKNLIGMASELGKSLNETHGVSLTGGKTALKALDGILGNDTKGELFKTVLKSLV